MTTVDILEISFNNIKDDYKNHNIDLFVAKIELESIVNKLLNQKQTDVLDDKVLEILSNSQKLLDEIEHEISLQTKEEFFNSNDHSI